MLNNNHPSFFAFNKSNTFYLNVYKNEDMIANSNQVFDFQFNITDDLCLSISHSYDVIHIGSVLCYIRK